MDQNEMVELTDEQLETIAGGVDVSVSEVIKEVPELKEVFPYYIYERNTCPMCVMNGWPREPLEFHDGEKPFYRCNVCHRDYYE